MSSIEVLYFSGQGHTAKQAAAIAEGANARLWAIPEDGQISDEAWDALDKADAIIFGSPTYMAGLAWQMKRVCDESSKRWFERKWQDKIAGGFTNSGSVNGNKGDVLQYFAALAAQHGMIWASLGQAPAHEMDNGPDDANWTGSSLGAMAISPADASVEDAPREGDLASARAYGQRIAKIALAARVLQSEDRQIAAE